ncbi:unnamed protein product [Sphagnum tenellum]
MNSTSMNNHRLYVYNYDDGTEDIKIGKTKHEDVDARIKQYTRTAGMKYNLLHKDYGIRDDGTTFVDNDVHARLIASGIKRAKRPGRDWFVCSPETAVAAILAEKMRLPPQSRYTRDKRSVDILRPSQTDAIKKICSAVAYGHKKFLLDAKPRFGKTLVALLASATLEAKTILILTRKPAVGSSWQMDCDQYIDFSGWNFYRSSDDIRFGGATAVVFVSFQDLADGLKSKHNFIHETKWDVVIVDESHHGDNENTSETLAKLNAGVVLYVSGTPYKALQSGNFDNTNTFTWTLADEQQAKKKWDYSLGANPYESMPGITVIALDPPETDPVESYDGRLNRLFSTTKEGKFVNEDDVRRFIYGFRDWTGYPYLKSEPKHALWCLCDVAACDALAEILRNDSFFKKFKINSSAGSKAGIGEAAFERTRDIIADYDKTITLTCGKLTTGVTFPEWTDILMLNDTESLAWYVQASFRVQSPSPGKTECRVWDFSAARAARIYTDMAKKHSMTNQTSETVQLERLLEAMPFVRLAAGKTRELNSTDIYALSVSSLSDVALKNRFARSIESNLGKLSDMLSDDDIRHYLDRINGKSFSTPNIAGTIVDGPGKTNGLDSKQTALALTPSQTPMIDSGKTNEKSTDLAFYKYKEKLELFMSIRIPTFMYLSDDDVSCIDDIINTTDTDLFELVFEGLKVNTFEKMMKPWNVNEPMVFFKKYIDEKQSIFNVLPKYSDSMVFTPPNLVKQLIDRIPHRLFSNPKATFYDAASANGAFLHEIYNRLFEGLKRAIPNEEERKQHILTKQLYWNPQNLVADRFTRKVLGSTVKNSISIDDLVKSKIMKFSVIIGNPPYQDPRSKGTKLWFEFVQKAIALTEDMLIFITPNSWFFDPTGSNMAPTINAMKTGSIVYADTIGPNEHFKVGEDIGYWVWKPEQGLPGKVRANWFGQDSVRDYNFDGEIPVINERTAIRLSVTEKVSSKIKDGNSIRRVGEHGMEWKGGGAGNDILRKETLASPTDEYPVEVRLSLGGKSNSTRYAKKGTTGAYGVVLNNSGFYFKEGQEDKYMPITSIPVAQNLFKIRCANEEEARNIKSYLTSKLYRCFVSVLISKYANDYALARLPYLGKDKYWTDQELYEYFDLSDDEIKFIEFNEHLAR